MKLALRLQLIIALLAVAACSKSRGSSPSRGIEPVALEESLADFVVDRDPNQIRATKTEEATLDAYDLGVELLTLDTGVNDSYVFLLEAIRDRVGISNAVDIEVAEDFRYSPLLEGLGGGVAGHQLILLDGKFLDIILEWSTFLVMLEQGYVDRDPLEALDDIVYLHNEYFGATTDGLLYPFFALDAHDAVSAEEYFIAYVGALVQHEFGHIFFYHGLDHLRHYGYLDPIAHLSILDEDDADLVAGMLIAKANCRLELGLEMLDILAFYSVQRFEWELTIWDVLAPDFQDAQISDHHSPLSDRKLLFLDGYQRYNDYWGLY